MVTACEVFATLFDRFQIARLGVFLKPHYQGASSGVLRLLWHLAQQHDRLFKQFGHTGNYIKYMLGELTLTKRDLRVAKQILHLYGAFSVKVSFQRRPPLS
jgi:hypothetical protein